MTPEELTQRMIAQLGTAAAENNIDIADGVLAEKMRVERPKNRDHGDWATNIALQLGKHSIH